MTHKQSIFYFTPREKKDLIISWLTLSIAFAVVISPTFLNTTSFITALPIALIGVGTGFVLHELAHRETAKHYGFHSEFRAWYPGLILAVVLAVMTGGQFVFAAPGATYFMANTVTKKQNGLISAAGPVVNIILGLILAGLGYAMFDAFTKYVLVSAAMINFWLALFNLIPIYPLDGSKVVAWKPAVWAGLIAISGILVFAPGFF